MPLSYNSFDELITIFNKSPHQTPLEWIKYPLNSLEIRKIVLKISKIPLNCPNTKITLKS